MTKVLCMLIILLLISCSNSKNPQSKGKADRADTVSYYERGCLNWGFKWNVECLACEAPDGHIYVNKFTSHQCYTGYSW